MPLTIVVEHSDICTTLVDTLPKNVRPNSGISLLYTPYFGNATTIGLKPTLLPFQKP
jgi:hypothetical protein